MLCLIISFFGFFLLYACPNAACVKECNTRRLYSVHSSPSSSSSSSSTASTFWSSSSLFPSSQACCHCLLKILVTLYLFSFICSYVVFLSMNSVARCSENTNINQSTHSKCHSHESEPSQSVPPSDQCKSRK